MKPWIEISSEYRFEKKISGESGLYAPAMTRYINMMKEIRPGDIILHYITVHGAKKEHASSIIGISKAHSRMTARSSRLTVDLEDIHVLPYPINRNDIFEIDEKLLSLKNLIRVNFQRYLSEISVGDLKTILEIHPENIDFVRKLKSYRELFSRGY